MKRQCTTTVLLALLAVFTGRLLQTTANKNGFFDCRRQGLSCGANGFCDMEGRCACKENHSAIFGQCVDEKTLEGNCTNDSFCENGGLCRVVRNESVCFCQDAFQGERCQRKRLEVKCYLHGMEIAVRPFPGFQGIVASRFNPVDECRLKENISDPTGPLFHTIVPFGSGDKYCGMISTLINGSRLYQMDVVIQYTPQIVFNTDQLLTSTCVFSKTGQVELQVGQPYIDSGNLTKAEDSKDITPLIFEVKDKNGSNLHKTSTVTVGDELNLVVKMQNNAAFTYYRVHAASASNGRDTFALVENGCPRKHQVIREFSSIAGNTTTTVTIPIFAFKFVTGDIVYFRVVVFMCEESSGACQTVMCDSQTDIANNRLRRQRRATEEEVVLTGQVRVKMPGETLEDNSEELDAGEMEVCMQQPEVQMMAILLGTGVVALAIACVAVFTCMWRRARRQEDKLSSPSPSSSSEQSFSIPRAKFEAAY
ncbi:EGF-like domain-containing protein 1 isoform X2 [Pomacea canaliculata]|uniref:EGF-like domain-containing protein 1 isoform X2 n=1 Tax=Pomacea canaliculata TaxID=400727 RepID=UPI000D7304AD|nr:EGF-like domain-containing protein 1 isoform X2 [Pomacea canaliculata]